jgi:hypothetical protein
MRSGSAGSMRSAELAAPSAGADRKPMPQCTPSIGACIARHHDGI